MPGDRFIPRLDVDANPRNADWLSFIRHERLLGDVETLEELKSILNREWISIADFKYSVWYAENLERLPWLRELSGSSGP